MFGFTTISVDSKGRLAIPAKYREQLISQNETNIVVTRDPQYPALKIYPGSIWNAISEELQSLQGLDPIVRNLQWTILGNANVCSFNPRSRHAAGASHAEDGPIKSSNQGYSFSLGRITIPWRFSSIPNRR
jgi:division/cell wall cluster transcriptional repressor MraZ